MSRAAVRRAGAAQPKLTAIRIGKFQGMICPATARAG